MFAIKNKEKNENIFLVDTTGTLTITGKINATDVSFVGGNDKNTNITGFADIAFNGGYTNLTGGKAGDSGNVLMFDDEGKVKSKKIAAGDVTGLADVANSGSYNDLLNKPTLFSGSYNDLSDTPKLKHVATSGRYTDLTGDVSEAGKLLYVDTDGSVTTISIADLKRKLS